MQKKKKKKKKKKEEEKKKKNKKEKQNISEAGNKSTLWMLYYVTQKMNFYSSNAWNLFLRPPKQSSLTHFTHDGRRQNFEWIQRLLIDIFLELKANNSADIESLNQIVRI